MLKNRYNPYTNQFERVPEDWVLVFNPFKNRYEYAPNKNGKYSYNQISNDFRMIEDAKPVFNVIEKRFELAQEGWEPTYNIYENEYAIAPKNKTKLSSEEKKKDVTEW